MTVVFTSLAMARFMQDATAMSLKKIITTMRPLRELTERVARQDITFTPEVPPEFRAMLTALQES